jgi:hypothetical protein
MGGSWFQACHGKKASPYGKIAKAKRVGGVVQAVEETA